MINNQPFFFLITFVISSLLFYFFQLFFINKGLIDEINIRSSHTSLATRSGGLSIFSVLILTSFFFYVQGIDIFDFSLIIPLFLLMVVGLYDDIYNIDFKLKFIFQIITAKILIDNGLIIDNLHGVFGVFELNRILAQVLTIFIIVAIINSINFIDGIDGLASTVILIFILMFEYFSNSMTPFFYLSLIIVSSIIPIYYFNFKKEKKVFLGDSGSLFLGGLASIYIIYILSNNYIIKPLFDVHKVLFVISIFFFPIIDIIRVFFYRILDGKSPFVADKNHLHHLLLRIFNKHYLIVLIVVLITIINFYMIQLIF